jgi:hypothetical protein
MVQVSGNMTLQTSGGTKMTQLTLTHDKTLAEVFGPTSGTGLITKQAALVVGGILFLIAAAKMSFLIPPSPVPVTMGTFAVLTIGAAYGPRLGLATMFGYLVIGAFGFDVFAGSSAALAAIWLVTCWRHWRLAMRHAVVRIAMFLEWPLRC